LKVFNAAGQELNEDGDPIVEEIPIKLNEKG
jgi:hypothetical protein